MALFRPAEFAIECYVCDASGALEFVSLDLLGPIYCGAAFEPAGMTYKGDGVWLDSPIADGREPVAAYWENITESFPITIRAGDPDAVMQATHRLFQVLTLATAYYAGVSEQPVWIKVRGWGQTNTQYAILKGWRLPRHVNPFAPPMQQAGTGSAVAPELPFTWEHGPWRDVRPVDAGTCVPIAGYGSMCYPCNVEFDGQNTNISIPDNAQIRDLHDAAMTVEAWVRMDGPGEQNQGIIAIKGTPGVSGWFIQINSNLAIPFVYAQIQCAVAVSYVTCEWPYTGDGLWHHIAFTWDDATYNYPRLWIDGKEPATWTSQTRNGAIVSDVGVTAYLGNFGTGYTWNGGIGWCRWSNQVRYTRDFTPPACWRLPATDFFTVGAWIGAECSGATIDNQQGLAAIDGTLNAGTFACGCRRYYGNVGPRADDLLMIECTSGVSYIQLGSGATIDDLPTAAGGFTIEAWVRPAAIGAVMAIAEKSDGAAAGWYLQLSGATVRINLFAAGNDAFANATLTTGAGEWVHIAAVYQDAGARTPRLWFNGVEPAYTLTQAMTLAYASDAAQNLDLSGFAVGVQPFNGDYGWLRASNTARYAADFTPPARCSLPAVDANTRMLVRATIDPTRLYDVSGNNNHGDMTAVTLGADCCDPSYVEDCGATADTLIDPVEDCEDLAVFVANKWNEANITHIFGYDSAVWSANLAQTSGPFPLLPSGVAGATHYIYFGSRDVAGANGGPFCSLIFNLLTASAGWTSATWEYWNGAWVGMVQTADLTASTLGGQALTKSGRGSFAFGQPADWTTTAVNGITGWWVRLAMVAPGGGGMTIPWQGDGEIYTVTWPYIEIQQDDIGGDIPALIDIQARAVGSPYGINLVSVPRVVVGLRSWCRGPNFTAYINTGEQLPPGFDFVQLVGDFGSSWATTAAGNGIVGSYATYTPGGGGTGGYIQWFIGQDAVNDWLGRFHVYARVHQNGGAAGNYSAYIQASMNAVVSTTKTVYTQSASILEVLDFGEITLGARDLLTTGDVGAQSSILIRVDGILGVTFRVWDLVFIPVDEWAAECISGTTYGVALGGLDVSSYVQIDGTERTRRKRALVRADSDDDIIYTWAIQSVGSPMVQRSTRQRLFFFCIAQVQSPVYWYGYPFYLLSAKLRGVQRYAFLRGAK